MRQTGTKCEIKAWSKTGSSGTAQQGQKHRTVFKNQYLKTGSNRHKQRCGNVRNYHCDYFPVIRHVVVLKYWGYN